MKGKALLMMMLIVCLPLYSATAFAVPDPNDACWDKVDDSWDRFESLDSILGPLESIASILFFISTVINTIDNAINLVANTIGMFEGPCCRVPPGLGASGCATVDAIVKPWKTAKSIMDKFTCFITCSWCSGQSCGGIPALGGVSTVMGKLSASPFDNIFTAVACLCPVAIVYNLRRLKSMYSVHACCAEQACSAGMTLEGCDQQLEEALCMYWQGGLARSAVKALVGLLSTVIAEGLAELLAKATWLNCVLTVLDLIETPQMLNGLKDAWVWMGESFDSAECSDLGFKDLEQTLEEEAFSETSTTYGYDPRTSRSDFVEVPELPATPISIDRPTAVQPEVGSSEPEAVPAEPTQLEEEGVASITGNMIRDAELVQIQAQGRIDTRAADPLANPYAGVETDQVLGIFNPIFVTDAEGNTVEYHPIATAEGVRYIGPDGKQYHASQVKGKKAEQVGKTPAKPAVEEGPVFNAMAATKQLANRLMMKLIGPFVDEAIANMCKSGGDSQSG